MASSELWRTRRRRYAPPRTARTTLRTWLTLADPADRNVPGERGDGEAIAPALPQAIQVADRWHRMENASRGFLDAVRRSMRQVREVVGAATMAISAVPLRSAHQDYCGGGGGRAIRALAEAGVRSAGSANVLATAVRWCVRSCVGSVRRLPVRQSRSMPSGDCAASAKSDADASGPSFGAARRDKASEDRCAHGRGMGTGPTASEPRSNGYSVCRRRRTLARWLKTVATACPRRASDRGCRRGRRAALPRPSGGVGGRRWRGWLRRDWSGTGLVASRSRSGPTAVRTAITMVNGDRGADHQTQAGKAPDVCRGKIDLLQARLIGLTSG